jgi:predicted metal-dependent enzyme (double-stranded beta helix superfamily)
MVLTAGSPKRTIARKRHGLRNEIGDHMFDVDRFIEDCQQAGTEAEPIKATEALVQRAVSDQAGIIKALGEPRFGGADKLYHGPDLTILCLRWYPGQQLLAHNHNVWAVIGLFTGQEDNTFYRTDNDKAIKLGGKTLRAGDVSWMGETAIHSVKNPINKITAALHVYGGDFFADGRSEWDNESHLRRPYDMERNLQSFQDGNAALEAQYAAAAAAVGA